MNALAVVARPKLLVRSITPVTAALGTRARTNVALTKVTSAGRRELLPPAKVTTVGPVSALRDVPVSVTSAPTVPFFGLKSETTGVFAMNSKLAALVA